MLIEIVSIIMDTIALIISICAFFYSYRTHRRHMFYVRKCALNSVYGKAVTEAYKGGNTHAYFDTDSIKGVKK